MNQLRVCWPGVYAFTTWARGEFFVYCVRVCVCIYVYANVCIWGASSRSLPPRINPASFSVAGGVHRNFVGFVSFVCLQLSLVCFSSVCRRPRRRFVVQPASLHIWMLLSVVYWILHLNAENTNTHAQCTFAYV